MPPKPLSARCSYSRRPWRRPNAAVVPTIAPRERARADRAAHRRAVEEWAAPAEERVAPAPFRRKVEPPARAAQQGATLERPAAARAKGAVQVQVGRARAAARARQEPRS